MNRPGLTDAAVAEIILATEPLAETADRLGVPLRQVFNIRSSSSKQGQRMRARLGLPSRYPLRTCFTQDGAVDQRPHADLRGRL